MQLEIVVISPTPCQYFIAEEQLARLAGGKGSRVRCLSGAAWITACGLLDDIALTPGQEFEVPNNGLVLIGAVGHCRFQLVPAAHLPVLAGISMVLGSALANLCAHLPARRLHRPISLK